MNKEEFQHEGQGQIFKGHSLDCIQSEKDFSGSSYLSLVWSAAHHSLFVIHILEPKTERYWLNEMLN